MTTSTIGNGGEVVLPDQVRARYGLMPHSAVRIVETRGGILLVPQTNAPMSEQLVRELAEWQALGAESWALFPYEDDES